jgi:MoxR-like ATPase
VTSAAPHLAPTGPSGAAHVREVARACAKVIRGKDDVIELALVAIVAGGHLLIEDLPGVGKSTLAQTLALAIGGTFRRIQFTSDLLPADLLGVNVWRAKEDRFEFRLGPLFANVVLADEINRAPPRTQSALLEAMAEHQISVDGTTHPLPEPFVVLATQNPEEHHGTYALPESQRDRFMLRLSLGYASGEVEAALLQGSASPRDAMPTRPVVELDELRAAQAQARTVFLHADLARYAQRVVEATRHHDQIAVGVSTRGALAWVAAARAQAFLSGRDRVTIDDLQTLAVAALAHRLMTTHGATSAGSGSAGLVADELIRDIVASVPVPV